MTSTEPASNAGLSSESIGTRTRSFAPGRVSTVRALGRSEPVYNLTVEGEHEYFANGILVANCADAFLYLCRTMLPKYDPEKAGPRQGSEEWIAQQMREEKARVVAERGKKKGAFA